MMETDPLIRSYFPGKGGIAGVPLDSHETRTKHAHIFGQEVKKDMVDLPKKVRVRMMVVTACDSIWGWVTRFLEI